MSEQEPTGTSIRAGQERVRRLRELPQEIPPARDLWPGIEAQIGARETGAARRAPQRLRMLAAAAVIAALAISVWVGRMLAPAPQPQLTQTLQQPIRAPLRRSPYLLDARYERERAALEKNLQARLAALPPETRDKVVSSLKTIQNSIRDLQAALGRDPANALLQELLVDTYQDEMRVLAAVNEAGSAGRGT
jgi:hypothetical protein